MERDTILISNFYKDNGYVILDLYKNKEFLKIKKFTDDWNPYNLLSTDASTVGNLDLDVINNDENI